MCFKSLVDSWILFFLQKTGSPKRMRTYSLEGRLPLGYDRESRMSSTISVNPRDISSPKKRNSTVSCATLPRSSDFRTPDSPGGSPRRRVPIIMAANDINTVLGRFHLRLKYDGTKEELFIHLVEGTVFDC